MTGWYLLAIKQRRNQNPKHLRESFLLKQLKSLTFAAKVSIVHVYGSPAYDPHMCIAHVKSIKNISYDQIIVNNYFENVNV